MPGEPRIGVEDLHAYIDGELDPVREAAVAAALASDPGLAAQEAAFRADKLYMKAIFEPVADRPLPDGWRRRIGEATPPRTAGSWRMAAAAALVVAALGGSALFWADQPDTILSEAASAHDGTLKAARVLSGSSLLPKAASDQMLASAVGLRLHAPDLARFGYRLAALDIYPGPAAGLVYRNAQGVALTMYIRRSAGEARFDLLRRGGLRVCIWQDDVVGAVLTGKMSAGEMMRVASAAYTDLNL